MQKSKKLAVPMRKLPSLKKFHPGPELNRRPNDLRAEEQPTSNKTGIEYLLHKLPGGNKKSVLNQYSL